MTEEKRNENHADLWRYVKENTPQIELALHEFLPLAPPVIETRFNEAVRYALFSGGKRLRPVLTLLGAELVGAKPETVLPAAVAVEFIHTSSLIFDDLPCMDNANERRGQTSLHARFGEGLAVLAAIGFLNASYALVFANWQTSPERAIAAHAEIVECVGAAGMLGGQSVDLALAASAGDFSNRNMTDAVSNDEFKFETIKNLKTSALMRLAVRVGAILAGAKNAELAHLSGFANLLGDAYQLSDDLIDLSEDGEIFSESKTFAIKQGKNAAQNQLENLIERAKAVLIENFPDTNARVCLLQLSDYLAERKA